MNDTEITPCPLISDAQRKLLELPARARELLREMCLVDFTPTEEQRGYIEAVAEACRYVEPETIIEGQTPTATEEPSFDPVGKARYEAREAEKQKRAAEEQARKDKAAEVLARAIHGNQKHGQP